MVVPSTHSDLISFACRCFTCNASMDSYVNHSFLSHWDLGVLSSRFTIVSFTRLLAPSSLMLGFCTWWIPLTLASSATTHQGPLESFVRLTQTPLYSSLFYSHYSVHFFRASHAQGFGRKATFALLPVKHS